MKRILFSIGSVLFAAATVIGVYDARHASACMSGSDIVGWELAPQSVLAVAPGNYLAKLNLDWGFRDIPFLGAAERAAGNVNIAGSPTYTPSYFYPSTCGGSIAVSVTGKLANPALNGLMRSRGWVWNSGNPAPFGESIHNLTVLHR